MVLQVSDCNGLSLRSLDYVPSWKPPIARKVILVPLAGREWKRASVPAVLHFVSSLNSLWGCCSTGRQPRRSCAARIRVAWSTAPGYAIGRRRLARRRPDWAPLSGKRSDLDGGFAKRVCYNPGHAHAAPGVHLQEWHPPL